MPKSKIKFYQEGSKEINKDGKIEVRWIIVNDSDFLLENVNVVSQINSHNFEDIDPQSKSEFKFYFKIPSVEMIKEDFGDDAIVSNPFVLGPASLTFSIKTDTFEMISDGLEFSF